MANRTVAEFDFFNKSVQSGLTEGQFVNAESILIACGPPNLAAMAGSDGVTSTSQTVAFPLGKVQQFSLGQNTAFQRIFEIGSKRSYFISGRSVGTLGLGRAYYHGPSLLRAAYAYYASPSSSGINITAMYDNGDAMSNVNPHDVQIAPGSGANGNLWLNLASDIFSQPMGFLIMIRDSNNATVGAFYAEYCVIPTHGFQFDSQSVVVQEQASFLFERLVPINLTGIVEVFGTASDPHGIIGKAVGLNS